VQYAATADVELLKEADAQISMASVGEPRENGYYSGPQKVDHSGQVHLLRPFPSQPPEIPAR
jgi:hypothetical protein